MLRLLNKRFLRARPPHSSCYRSVSTTAIHQGHHQKALLLEANGRCTEEQWRTGFVSAAAAALLSAVAVGASAAKGVSQCQDSEGVKVEEGLLADGTEVSMNEAEAEEADIAYLLLHPHDEDIDNVVAEILRDPEINLSVIPDAIESRIYRSTIQLTLSIIYSILASVDRTEMLSHEIRIRKLPRVDDEAGAAAPIYSKSTRKINDAILEQVADRLLANKAINSMAIPDFLERQIYINCIKIIFRTFTAVLEGFCLSICGHELRMSLSAAQAATAVEKAMSSLSEIDLELLRQYARDSGVAEATGDRSWLESLFWREEFSVHLHASMYGLVLGIVDDLLANTKINVLGDTMEFDIVPQKDPTTVTRETSDAKSVQSSGGTSSLVASACFAAGVGVGAAVVTVVALFGSN